MTERLRSLARKSKIIKTISVGVYAKLVGVLVAFAMVPIAIHYLGVEKYGLWIAVSSLIAMLSFADGGVGNALVNMTSQAMGAQSNKSLLTIVSTGFFVLIMIALVGLLLFALLYQHISWGWILGFSEGVNTTELMPLLLIVGIGFFLGMPCSVVGNVQRGLQDGNVEAFWSAKGQLLALFFVYISIRMNSGLVGFAIAYISGPLVSALLNSSYYFLYKRKDLFPRLSFFQAEEMKSILRTGGLFFVLQITAVIQSKADNVIIANMLGLSAVAQYAICMQLFLVAPMVMCLLWTPLWPAYREAFASGDIEWIKRVFAKSMKLAMAIGIPVSITL
ncbi:MAG: oligosaccharide flippase family protein, partial [Mariprofundus sp.]|nr:oligosaccharide flippase family protein [Mariprofundus sp.]